MRQALWFAVVGVLLAASLAFAQAPTPITVADTYTLSWNQQKAFTVNLPPAPAGYRVLLHFLARQDTPTLAGSMFMLRTHFNGTHLTRARLANKDNELAMANGTIAHWFDGSAWRLMYSPDFKQGDGPDGSPSAIITGKAYEFELDVTDLVKPGDNEILLIHPWQSKWPDVVVKDLSIVFRKPEELYNKPGVKPEAPTGPLPTIAPQTAKPLKLRAFLSPGGGITVAAGPQLYHLTSDLTYPAGGHNTLTRGHDPTTGHATWTTNLLDDTHARGHCQFYDLQREVKVGSACVEVSDTITNLTDDDLGMIIRHTAEFAAGDAKEYRLGGLKPSLPAMRDGRGGNPTSFVSLGNHSLGLLPRDDVFRVHCLNYYDQGQIGLEEHYFALPPKGTYTLRWSIFPGATGSYWDFINSARRVLDANFTLDGGFGFSHYVQFMENITPEVGGQWCGNRSLKYVCNSNPYDKGIYVQGTGYLEPGMREQLQKRWEINNTIVKACPGAKNLIYYHCYISTEAGAADKYKDSVVHDANGKQLDYNDPHYPIFLPTLSNSYGQAMQKLIDTLLVDLKFDGIYWDEFAYSNSQYMYDWPQWDGHSALIDPATGKITRKISFQTLVSQPFRMAMAKKILGGGHPLIANGEPLTETEMKLHFPHFVETGGPAAMNETHLFSPVGLSDSMTEETPADCARNMRRHLDYGCVYYYYFFKPQMPHPMLTEYMYPITPMELQEGYIIGKERILTNRAGVFGWGDKSNHEVHVFDENGDPIALPVKTFIKSGATWTELRLPEGYTAAIVRK